MHEGPQRSIFTTQAQAIEALAALTRRLAALVTWGLLALLHLALVLAVLIALWWCQVTPAQIALAAHQALQTTTFAALGTLGVSAVSVLAAYGWLLKKVHGALHRGPVLRYLMRDAWRR